MKSTKLIGTTLALLLAIVGGGGLQAQRLQSRYVISAKAGGINLILGEVAVTRKGTTEKIAASSIDSLESGDEIETGSDGRVELLLNPGSYLRLGANSALALTDTSLGSLRVNLVSGVAILEVAGADEVLAPVEVQAADTIVMIDRAGIYRVDNRNPAVVRVRVQKGIARVNDQEFDEGKEITIDSIGAVKAVKFDNKEQDAFEEWSSSRAATLAEANGRLTRATVKGLSAKYRKSTLGRIGSGGYWIYDPVFGSRTFLPYYAGWSSPYGREYRRGFGFPHAGSKQLFRQIGGTWIGSGSRRPTTPRPPVFHRGGRRH